MRDSISTFLAKVDAPIRARGHAYCLQGNVKHFCQNGNIWTAEVEGSTDVLYSVTVQLHKNGDIKAWSCNCPYDRGNVCKHVVAVLMKMQQNDARTEKSSSCADSSEDITLAQLLQTATQEELCEIISAHARVDEAFYAQTVSILGVPIQQELRLAKECIRSSIQQNTRRGYIEWTGCDRICTDMDAVLVQARRRMERGQPSEALLLAECIALSGIKLAASADSSSGSLTMTINNTQALIVECCKLLCQEDFTDEDRRQSFDELLKTAHRQAFDAWPAERHALLRAAIPLCNPQSAAKLYAFLDKLLKVEMQKSFPEYYVSLDKQTRFYLIRAQQGAPQAHEFLMQNLDIDAIRKLAVQELLDDGKYEEAERLCLEKIATDSSAHFVRPSYWETQLYTIYESAGAHDKQVAQAKRLYLLGDINYYDTLKTLLQADGTWETVYPSLLEEVHQKCSCYEYMCVLSKENEVELLMDAVRCHPEMVFSFATQLALNYREEIAAFCCETIKQQAECAADRRGYKAVCRLIGELAGFGCLPEARRTILLLREDYPRRPAFLDELSRTERNLCAEKS
jgi:hypothetical protein